MTMARLLIFWAVLLVTAAIPTIIYTANINDFRENQRKEIETFRWCCFAIALLILGVCSGASACLVVNNAI